MNRENLRSPARSALKNPNFRSFFKLGKTCKYSLIPKFQSSNFESIDELRKICPSLSYTIENKMRNLHKTIWNLIWWMRYLSMNWEKCVSNWRKKDFCTYWKFWMYHRNFDLKKSPANILSPLSLNFNNADINSSNSMYRKSILVRLKKTIIFKKMSLKFRNPTFNISFAK